MRGKWNVWMTFGLFLLASALVLSVYNLLDDRRAGEESAHATEQLAKNDAFSNQSLTLSQGFSPETPMPTEMVDGKLYIGRLRIPALGLELPIIGEWDDESLRTAPCRYAGSAYAGDMVIAGHNYASHFGDLRSIDYGTEVSFTDVRGNVFLYKVASIEELDAYDVSPMTESEWELTLFTCTFDGLGRVTVRCEEIIPEVSGYTAS